MYTMNLTQVDIEKETKSTASIIQKRSYSDTSEHVLAIVLIVIAAIIIMGSVIMIIIITCELREEETVVPTEPGNQLTPNLETRKAVIFLPPVPRHSPSLPPNQLAPVEETATAQDTPGTPVDMQTQPPPLFDPTHHPDHAASSEMGYFSNKGTTLREVTDEFRL